jgi:hypothetical protein
VAKPTDEKGLALYTELTRINQAWVVLWVVLGIVVLLTIAILYATFFRQDVKLAGINGGLDGIFGWCLKIIVRFHFPTKEKGIVTSIKEKLLGDGEG